MSLEKIKHIYQKLIIKKSILIIFCVIVFFLSLGVKSLPLIKKQQVIVNDHIQLVLARNMAWGLGYKIEAKDGLIKEFKLTSEQAQAILEMQLQRLTGLERNKIEEEYLELIKKFYFLF